jgi:hypothetical protein
MCIKINRTLIAWGCGALAWLFVGAETMPAQEVQEPASPEVIWMCYLESSGVLYRVNPPDQPGLDPKLQDECRADKEVLFGWTVGVPGHDHGALNGLEDDDHPEYVREGEAAGGDLGATYLEPTVVGLQGNPISATDPSAAGQVLMWNGSAWEPRDLEPGFSGDHGELDAESLTDDDHLQYLLTNGVRFSQSGFKVTGPGPGIRLHWYSPKAAFRAGRATPAEEMDPNTIGQNSLATGQFTLASGAQSTAMGQETTAGGMASTAMGHESEASGHVSTAMGGDTHATGSWATAMGYQTWATGNQSTAMGNDAMAIGEASTALGSGTRALGNASVAMGTNTTAQAAGSVVMGHYNVMSGSTTGSSPGSPQLVVGNGADELSRSNSLTLYRNGNMTIGGLLTENSDARFKTDIEPLTDVLARIQGIRGVTFRFKNEQSAPAGRQLGLLAQEVQQAFPELVHEDSQGYLSLAYGNFTAVLLEAIKEQQSEIEALRQRIAAMENGSTIER